MSTTRRHHRYYDLLLTAFVVVLLCSNFIGAGKAAIIDLPYFGTCVFGGGILFFPIAYFFGDVLTEVYGYAYDRRAFQRLVSKPFCVGCSILGSLPSTEPL